MPSPAPEWFKSSYSMQNGECVEARHSDVGIDIRDSKTPFSPTLGFSAPAWEAFLAETKTPHSA